MSSTILLQEQQPSAVGAFLTATGPRDRSVPRTAAFLGAAIAAAVAAALIGGLVVTLLFAGLDAWRSDQTLAAAIGTLADSGRANRSLLSFSYELSVAGIGSYAAVVVVLGLAVRIYGRPLHSFLTSVERFRWRLVGAGFVIGLPLTGLAFLGEWAAGSHPSSPPVMMHGSDLVQRLGYASIALVMLYLAAFAEEAIFRGWLLQQTGAWTRNLAVLLGVNGVAFSLAHFDPNVVSFMVRAIMGVGWAWIALRTAGVEFTTGAHLANNLFVALFVAPISFAPSKPEPFDLRPALLELAIVGAMALIVEIGLRRRTRPAAN